MPFRPVYEVEEVESLITAAGDFLDATDWVVIEQLRGETPQTQSEMNSQAGRSLDNAQQEMSNLLDEIRMFEGISLEHLNASQEAWDTYACKEADLHASLVEGGSMYPLIWASAKVELVEARIKALRWWLSREEGDL